MRSTLPTVRNPVLALPAWRRLRDLPTRSRRALAQVLRALAQDASERGERCWRKSKPPMAAYWKAVGVWAKHLARATEATRG